VKRGRELRRHCKNIAGEKIVGDACISTAFRSKAAFYAGQREPREWRTDFMHELHKLHNRRTANYAIT
jgi:hypothetical protein